MTYTSPELTGQERTVATLAGSGLTNRGIARRLHITVSTVEQHLTRIYRKLGTKRAGLIEMVAANAAASAGVR